MIVQNTFQSTEMTPSISVLAYTLMLHDCIHVRQTNLFIRSNCPNTIGIYYHDSTVNSNKTCYAKIVFETVQKRVMRPPWTDGCLNCQKSLSSDVSKYCEDTWTDVILLLWRQKLDQRLPSFWHGQKNLCFPHIVAINEIKWKILVKCTQRNCILFSKRPSFRRMFCCV